MNSRCRQCHEIVESSYRSCPACGVDLRIHVPDLIDLTDREVDDERERADLLEALLAGTADAPDGPPGHRAPEWGVHTVTMLDLELAPVRIGRFPTADDVVPAGGPAPKRGRRRR